MVQHSITFISSMSHFRRSSTHWTYLCNHIAIQATIQYSDTERVLSTAKVPLDRVLNFTTATEYLSSLALRESAYTVSKQLSQTYRLYSSSAFPQNITLGL